ncbi:MAG: zinc-binding dehydrogenase [bacterium]|nr:zinc-binding dehydrogenase [bacterium]
MMHLLAYKADGASKVIMVGLDQDRERFEIACRLGADHIINLSTQDAAEAILEYTDGRGADIVVETANSPKAAELTVTLAAPRGRVVLFGLYPEASFSPLQMLRKKLTVHGGVAQVTRQFVRAIDWMETGKVSVRELVKNRFSLDDAERAFETARKGEVAKVIFEL